MDLKPIIQKELTDFLLTVVESYHDLVISTIPDARFDKLVTELKEAQAKTADKLLVAIQKPLETDVAPSPKLLGPATPPPRQVKEDVAPEQVGQFMEAATKVSSGVGEALLDFGDDALEIDHKPPTMTLAEEKRIEAGLPRKLYRPHIHVDHTGRQEVSPNGVPLAPSGSAPTAPSMTASSSITVKPVSAPPPARDLFEKIRVAVEPLLKERNSKVREIGFAITALVAQGLALDYTPTQISVEPIAENMEVAVEAAPFEDVYRG